MREIENIDFITDEVEEGPLKRAVLFNDISGFGKCSLTVALPVLSAAGIEGCLVPTAILSTHTGGFENFTFRDLTEDLEPYLEHWNSLEIPFDALYSGYLGSPEQAEILKQFILFQKKRNPDLLTYIDPVMGDNGILYTGFGEKMVEAMRELLPVADIVLPNLTEALALLGREFYEGPYSEEYLKEITSALRALGPQKVLLTGIPFEDKVLTAIDDGENFELISAPKVEGSFHGTGDVFGSFTLAGLMNDLDLIDSAELGSTLTYGAVKRTEKRKTARREGVDFEGMLPLMQERIKDIKLSKTA